MIQEENGRTTNALFGHTIITENLFHSEQGDSTLVRMLRNVNPGGEDLVVSRPYHMILVRCRAQSLKFGPFFKSEHSLLVSSLILNLYFLALMFCFLVMYHQYLETVQ